MYSAKANIQCEQVIDSLYRTTVAGVSWTGAQYTGCVPVRVWRTRQSKTNFH